MLVKTSNSNHKNVYSEVVANNLCYGCGICVSVCKNGCLNIGLNQYGENTPFLINDKCNNCGICLKICSHYSESKCYSMLESFHYRNGIHSYNSLLGSYIENYVGYSCINDHRANGASGGITTWILEKLLTEQKVDAVLCVGINSNDSKRLYKFHICTTTEDVRQNSKSKYYPVEMSEIVSYVMKNNLKVAITALPCAVKSLRLAMKYNSLLNDRIKYILSFTCGMGPSHSAAEYLCANSGGDPYNLDEIIFRNKIDEDASSKNFVIKCISNKDKSNEKITFQNFFKCLGPALEYRLFSLKACDYCDDIFGEYADASMMDAWLPQYFKDHKGNNIVIVRNSDINKMICKGIENNELLLKVIDYSSVINSQLPVVDFKRILIKERIKFARMNKEQLPPLREELYKKNIGYIDKKRAFYMMKSREASREIWIKCNKDAILFNNKMNPLLKRLILLRRLKKIFNFYAWYHFIKKLFTKKVSC